MNIQTRIVTAAALAGLSAFGACAAENIQIANLGPNNTMVKIHDVESNFLLIPVQENQPISHVRVLADSKLEETFNISLAATKVDYYVPFDMRRFKGDHLLLDVRTNTDRTNMRDGSQAAWLKDMEFSNTFDVSNHEKYRPAYHHTPAWGWMNDPNGMFYKDGVWHLYYQYNPYGSKWQNMTWGHSTSTDLINWEAQPIAIRPNALGMIFSGSSVVDHNNTAGFGKDAIISFYTSADASQVQSMAYSTDGGMTFTEYDANPVIAYERESRDPNIFWDADHNQWVLEIASALDHEVVFYTSPNLKDWTQVSKFGHGFGCQDGVWECPDLMKLPVEGTNEEKWVLLLNINPGGPTGGSACQYFVGDWNGKEFKCDNGPETTKWMDWGKDHYATVSFFDAPDNRKTVIAWMSNWQYAPEVPTKQFRSANSLPRDLYLFKAPDGEYYLASAPSPEVKALRGKEQKVSLGSVGESGKKVQLPKANDGICEIVLGATVPSGRNLVLVLSNEQGEKVEMKLDGTKKDFSMDRTKAGISDFSENFPAVTTGPIYPADDNYEFRIFIDRASIEAFVDNGRLAMTNLVFPNSPYTTLTVKGEGGKVKCSTAKIYPIIPTKNPDVIK